MSDVLSVEQAEELATRVRRAIPFGAAGSRYDADREHVGSDLAGLRDCWNATWLVWHRGYERHARRYSDGLLRTARLYGVTPQPADGGAVPPQPAAVRAPQHGP